MSCGAGHSIGAAVTPWGSFQESVVGRPESPGLRQYVCQCGSIFRRSATASDSPGTSAVRAATSSASTWGVLTGAAAAGTARAAATASAATDATLERAAWLRGERLGRIIGDAYAPRRRFEAAPGLTWD